jgi:CubicO group peptidase (beta-lactamase class C family)
MRAKTFAALAAILALSTGATRAQETETPTATAPPAAPAETAAPTTANPAGPIPYDAYQRRIAPQKRAARPAAAPAATAAAASPAAATPSTAATGATPTAQALPTTPSGARLALAEPLPPAELEAFVDGVVREAMARDHIAGVTVSVVQDGQIVLKKGYGFAATDPARAVDPDRTLFRIGSISKTFTWIALMNEVEAGRIRIDAPVNLYLPERLQIRDQGYSAPIRVIHLLDHSAGFEDRALGHLFERRVERVRPLANYLRQERPRRVRAPGEIASYSNYSVALAGQALSYVSGKTFERLIEDEILRPIGMNRTTFREPHPNRAGLPAPMAPALAADVSTGYRWTPDGFQARGFEYIGQVAPAGSASSTAADMARYMLLLLGEGALDGTVVYGPKAAQAFRTPIRRTPEGINGWRHGFIDYALPGGLRGYGHDGATLSFMSSMVVIPQLRAGVFISANTDTGAELTNTFADRLVQQFYAPPRTFPRAGSAALKAQANAFEGFYVGTRRASGGLEKAIGLALSGASVRVNEAGLLVVSAGGRTRTYAPVGEPAQGLFVETDGVGRLAFRMSNGKASAFQTDLNAQTYQRSGFWLKLDTLALLALLTLIAAASTVGGVIFRNRREHRETPVQGRASIIQNTQAALWLTAFALVGLWSGKASDVARVMYGWPGGELVIAAACCLVAAVLTVLTLILLPAVWRGGRRVDSWSPLRKLAFTGTTLTYAALSIVLALWGVLTPWGG